MCRKMFFLVFGIFSFFSSISLSAASRRLVPEKESDYNDHDDRRRHTAPQLNDDDQYTISFYLAAINLSLNEFEINGCRDSIFQLINRGKVPTHENLRFVYWKVTSPFTGPQFPYHHMRMRAYREIYTYFEQAGHPYEIVRDCCIS